MGNGKWKNMLQLIQEVNLLIHSGILSFHRPLKVPEFISIVNFELF